MPTTKRRRLDKAALTLSKPFKSPLRNPPQRISGDEARANEKFLSERTDSPPKRVGGTQIVPIPSASSGTAAFVTISSTGSVSLSQASLQWQAAPRSDTNEQTTVSISSPAPSLLMSSLQKQQSALHSRLSLLRQDLEAAEQALKLEQTGQDVELEALIVKWKSVSRETAEELFASARDRVNRMGGVRAWKETIRSGRETNDAWDRYGQDARSNAIAGEWAGSDLEDEMKRRKEELEDEIADEHRGAACDNDGKTDSDGGDEVCSPLRLQFFNIGRESTDESSKWSGLIADLAASLKTFTMDMMLKSLNIELSVIGFDNINQRWLE